MTDQTFPDEVLMSYADGELDEKTARALETALETDAALARRLALFTGTGDALAALRAANPPAPAPEELTSRVKETLARARAAQSATVTPFAAPPAAANRNWRPAAIAAGLALALGLGAGFGAGRFGERETGDTLAILDEKGLSAALSTLKSGEEINLAEGAVAVVASFRTAEGAFCREFSYERPGAGAIVSVACRENDLWRARLALAAPAAGAGGYVPASGLDTLEGYLTDIGAGAALSAEDEAGLLGTLHE